MPASTDRRAFLQGALAATGALACTRRSAPDAERAPVPDPPMSPRQPVLFVGHGSPLNAIEDNAWSRGMVAIGRTLRAPRAILSVSAHWFVPGTFVTLQEEPPTIHDFGGFPDELFRMQYPAPGSPELARRVAELLDLGAAGASVDWGLDHGTWSVLVHLRPAADVPVVQLGLDARAGPARHLELARRLAPLRDEGVLILGSGNLTHDLRDAFGRMRAGDTATPPWAARFDADAARALEQHDERFLARALDTPDGRASHPTPDHYLPVLYALGAASADDPVSFPITGFDMGSLSMRAVRFG